MTAEAGQLWSPPMSDRAPRPTTPPFDMHVETRGVEGAEVDDELASLAKAIGHPARIQILRYLGRRPTCVLGDIARELPLDPTTARRHLEVLKAAGFIQGEIDGPTISYSLAKNQMRRLRALIAAL
jgi:ArsR family transcriptional regulator